jgi:hypothetical protein
MSFFISESPLTFGIVASALAMLYFFLMTVNPNLPPALVFSIIIGYFVYSIKSGGVKNIQLPRITMNYKEPALLEPNSRSPTLLR